MTKDEGTKCVQTVIASCGWQNVIEDVIDVIATTPGLDPDSTSAEMARDLETLMTKHFGPRVTLRSKG